MSKANDLTGKKFAKYLVIEYAYSKNSKRYYLCQCDCGETRCVSSSNLTSGNSKSCGCQCREKNRLKHTTHGKSKTRLHSIWKGIKKRCFNKKCKDYKDYGGRGITICNEWLDYLSFESWAIRNGYEDNLTIERKDVNLGYNAENCTWIPNKEQSKNRRMCIPITFKGETHTLAEWSRILGLSLSALKYRKSKGWSYDKMLRTPIDKKYANNC